MYILFLAPTLENQQNLGESRTLDVMALDLVTKNFCHISLCTGVTVNLPPPPLPLKIFPLRGKITYGNSYSTLGAIFQGVEDFVVPGTNIIFRTTLPCQEVVNDFHLPKLIFDLPKISYNICRKGIRPQR